jgi:hypothetical protein
LFFLAKSDLVMVCRKIEPRLIKGDSELPIVVFDGPELGQNLNSESGTLRFLTRREGVRNPTKMLHHKAK